MQATLLVRSTRDFELPATEDADPTAGPLETTVNGPGSIRKQRAATATGQVTFNGEVLVNGEANHPTRPSPFIRNDIDQ